MLSHTERHVLIADNVPILWSIVTPTILIALAGLGIMDLHIAIDISIIAAVAGLFAVGVIQSPPATRSPRRSSRPCSRPRSSWAHWR